jgi:hypothetical protein
MNTSKKTKIIAFSIVGAAALSLIGAGAAAWIIATVSAGATNPFTINVGEVTDQSVAINNITITDAAIRFDAEQGDTTGPIVADGVAADAPSLDFAFSYDVTNYAHVNAINAKWTVSNELQTAITNNYLVAPLSTTDAAIGIPAKLPSEATYYDGGTTVKTDFKEKLVVTHSGTSAHIVATYQFAWGTAFNGQNPSVYATDANLADVRTALNTLYAANSQTFTITLTPVYVA